MNYYKNIELLLDQYENINLVFLSIGNPHQKAVVKLFKKDNIKRKIKRYIQEFRKKSGKSAQWIKIDFVIKVENVNFNVLKNDLISTRRNYVEYGFSLDTNWKLAFLPEEINANAFLKPKDNKLVLSEQNINSYLKRYKQGSYVYRQKDHENTVVQKFYTKGYFIENDQIISLEEQGYRKGLRIVENLNEEIDNLIKSSTNFLKNQIQEDGKYIYGYFPHFDRQINFYNNLRHSSSTYALIEGLSYVGQDITVAKKAIDYLISNYLYEKDGVAYIYDDTKDINEIKLGQNAAFVFAICEYLKHNPDDLNYLSSAQKVARGILRMIKPNNETIHVLNYPELTVKEKFRIVYYDGEAALALLRLYQIDQNKKWLNTVKALFEMFIENDYWQYHDHWLGYCTNELVQLEPEEKYYKFGIQNVSSYLDYIQNRETTFPTFLEMLMATYKLVERAKHTGFSHIVKEHLDEEKFIDTIHIRADYQRTGYFYPEIAMYFKKPERILHSFFIKHHGYRVRIDDIEHYVSGYVQYQKVFNSQ